MDFANICRTCLYPDQMLFSVFDPIVSEDDPGLGNFGTSAAEMLESFTTVKIIPDDDLPTKICVKCLDQIHNTYTFKTKCESTQIIIRSLLEEFTTENVVHSIDEKPFSDSNTLSIDQSTSTTCEENPEAKSETSDLTTDISTSNSFETAASIETSDKNSNQIILEELSNSDEQLLNFDLENIADIDNTIGSLDNIIIEYGDPLSVPKDNPELWIENFYDCPGCEKQFKKIGLLRNHIVDVHIDGKLCKICNEKYKSRLWKHIFSHMPEKTFTCAKCEKSFFSQFNLQMHQKMAHGVCLTCEYCSKQFRNTQKFRDHVFEHTGKHDFQCDVCLKVLKRKSALTLHKQKHTGERPFKCEKCSKRFGYKANLKFHMNTVHGKEEFLHECDVCKEGFKNRAQLAKHKFIHTGNADLQCDICKEVLESKHKMELHRRKHTGEKPFECEVCRKRFRIKCHLKSHMETHSSVRPYQCQVCPLQYKRSQMLRVHIKTMHPGYAKKNGSRGS